jgi:hypothetical protein
MTKDDTPDTWPDAMQMSAVVEHLVALREIIGHDDQATRHRLIAARQLRRTELDDLIGLAQERAALARRSPVIRAPLPPQAFYFQHGKVFIGPIIDGKVPEPRTYPGKMTGLWQAYIALVVLQRGDRINAADYFHKNDARSMSKKVSSVRNNIRVRFLDWLRDEGLQGVAHVIHGLEFSDLTGNIALRESAASRDLALAPRIYVNQNLRRNYVLTNLIPQNNKMSSNAMTGAQKCRPYLYTLMTTT